MGDTVVVLCPIAYEVPPKTFQSAMSVVAQAAKDGVDIVHIGVTERECIDGARNGLAEAFLQTRAEWSFWMDADMILPPNTLTELLRVAKEQNAKIVTGIYYQRKGKNYPVLWSRDEELETGGKTAQNRKAQANKYAGTFCFPHPDKKKPFKVHAAGFGCILVHRNVFESLDTPWFNTVNKVCSEDFYFLVNAGEKGFDTWAVPTLDLGHIGEAQVVTKKTFHDTATKDNIFIEPIAKQENLPCLNQ